MKVKYFPWQPHCFAFGGFEIQMLSTLQAVKKAGVTAEKMDVWSRDKDFDILHLWGVGPYNYMIIDFARNAGKAVIATVLLPYHDTLRSNLGYLYRELKMEPLKNYYKKIDNIVVLNESQKNILARIYNYPADQIEIIPNIVHEKFFKPPSSNFSEKYGMDNYVLCTGNISPRKNQYNLATACVNLNINLVLIGNTLDGEKKYGDKLKKFVNNHKNILWINELPAASDELAAAYANCKLYALPSKNETQPISALEAVAMKKPLLLCDRRYARQKQYEKAFLCKSPSVGDITKALDKALGSAQPPAGNRAILECTEENVGRLYKRSYEKLV